MSTLVSIFLLQAEFSSSSIPKNIVHLRIVNNRFSKSNSPLRFLLVGLERTELPHRWPITERTIEFYPD